MDVKRVRLIGIKCRNLKANKWEQTERQIAGYLFSLWIDVNSFAGGAFEYANIFL